jgi:PD-(D/E)XK nuclease superfamily
VSTVWTSRSQIEDFERCPRLCYYRYHYGGTGLEGYGIQLEAEMGTAIHTGIEVLLQGYSVDTAVYDATVYINLAIAKDPTPPHLLTDNRRFEYEEAPALVEACVRGWALARLPRIVTQGKCLSIEREHPIKFTTEGGQVVGLQTRPDIVWQRTTDGAVFIRNIKTTKVVDDKFREQWKIDMQTLSEPLAVEQTGVQVSGVIVEGVAKGKKLDFPASALPDLAGKYYHNNPLIYGWHREAEPPFTMEQWEHRYEWTDLSGQHRRLGKGYRKVPIWRAYPGGVAAWINHVWSEDASAFDDLFVELEPILRSDYEIERWKRQTLGHVAKRQSQANNVEAARLGDKLGIIGPYDTLIDSAFPMHTSNGNCIWPRRCTYWSLCHGTAAADPIGSGEFQPRTPHHPIPVEDL